MGQTMTSRGDLYHLPCTCTSPILSTEEKCTGRVSGHLLSLLMENETTRLSGAQTEGRISLSMSKRHIGQKPWLHVVTSLIPTSHDIGLVRIKTTAMPMVVVRFHIRSLREPPLNCSHSQADPLGDLFGLHPLLMERHHLLVALIALGLVR